MIFVVVLFLNIVLASPTKLSPIYLNQTDEINHLWFTDNANKLDNNSTITLNRNNLNHPIIIGRDALDSDPVVVIPRATTCKVGDQLSMTAELIDTENFFYVAENEGSFNSPNIKYLAPYVITNTEATLLLTIVKIDGVKTWIVSGGYADTEAYFD